MCGFQPLISPLTQLAPGMDFTYNAALSLLQPLLVNNQDFIWDFKECWLNPIIFTAY